MKSTSESRNLDLLRSLAVLFVVAFHILLFFQATRLGRIDLHSIGHLGVLLFFVHTSVVLMFSLERQIDRAPNKAWLLTYYLRRAFRILPLSVLIVLAVYFLHLPVAHLHGGTFSAVHLSNSELLSNLLLVQNLTHADSIIAPLWSLPYEMQMYLALPLLFLITRMSRNVFMIAGVWILSAAAGISLPHIHRYQFPDLLIYVPCFVAGVIGYKLTESRTRNWPFLGWPLMIAAVTVLYLRNPSMERGWLCCLLVALALPQFREMRAGWLSTACHQVARYSYGIYLTHFIAIWFSFVALHSAPMAVRCFVLLATLFIFPVVLYHAVETPMIELGRQWTANLGLPRARYRRLPIPSLSAGGPRSGD